MRRPATRSLIRATLLVVALATVGASCGPVGPPPPSPVPMNVCPPDSCAAYAQPNGLDTPTCDPNGQCVSSKPASFDFTLVVSLPETYQALDNGVTTAIPQFLSRYLTMTHECGAPNCAVVPPLLTPSGNVSVNPATEDCAGRLSTKEAVLAADVQYWPLWPPPSSSSLSGSPTPGTVPASSVGLPLTTLEGRVTVDSELGLGPSGTPGTTWSAVVPPGYYEQDIFPLDTAYPPTRTFGPASDAFTPLSLSADECTGQVTLETTFNVARGNGSLDGFSTYFQDPSTLRRVSSLRVLPDAALASAAILTNLGSWPPPSSLLLDVVVVPPAGAPIPTYVDPIATVTGQVGQVNFPPLPTPLTVSGTVVGPDGATAIEADLVIVSTAPSPDGTSGGIVICTTPACLSTASGSTPRPLTYQTTTHAAAVDGRYSVVLPPGTYNVCIVPAAGAPAGVTPSVPLEVQVLAQGLPPVAAGKQLVAAAPATIEGTVTLADGRPLVAATVQARPAVSLASAALPTPIDPRCWPRAVAGVTDGAGRFSFVADPGTYDVVVQPVEGTGFPWLTAASRTVSPGGTLSFAAPGSALVVPAPFAVDLTLKEPTESANDNPVEVTPIAGAVVRAYALGAPPVAGALAPEIELGAWLTDANGHFTMLLALPE